MTEFQSLTIRDEVLRSLKALQFVTMTPVQDAVIPKLLTGQDLVVCAETGSGKTGAYAIPLVHQLLEQAEDRALILAPTRELAQQIADFIRSLTRHAEQVRVTCLVGGADMHKQVKALKKKPRIIVGTPGRLNDHIQRGTIDFRSTNHLIIDEGDRMLDMGFAPQINTIIAKLPSERRTSLFTATISKAVRMLMSKYLKSPEHIQIGEVSRPVSSIRQGVLQVAESQKQDKLLDELNARKGSVIIFMRTKRRTDAVAKNLKGYGMDVDFIHGGRSQGQRNRAIKRFRDGASRILCATDVAARGLDVPQVEHVINFDLPMMDDDYVHRIGRTARNGADGEALSFVTPADHRAWIMLARKFKIANVELAGVAEPGKKRGGFGGRKQGGRPGAGRGFAQKRGFRSEEGGGYKRKFRNEEGDSRKRNFRGEEGDNRKPKFRSEEGDSRKRRFRGEEGRDRKRRPRTTEGSAQKQRPRSDDRADQGQQPRAQRDFAKKSRLGKELESRHKKGTGKGKFKQQGKQKKFGMSKSAHKKPGQRRRVQA